MCIGINTLSITIKIIKFFRFYNIFYNTFFLICTLGCPFGKKLEEDLPNDAKDFTEYGKYTFKNVFFFNLAIQLEISIKIFIISSYKKNLLTFIYFFDKMVIMFSTILKISSTNQCSIYFEI